MKMTLDRGSVVLTGPFDSVDPSELPGVPWDPRVSVWRAPALGYRALERALRGCVRDEVAGWGPRQRRPLPELRPYQSDALHAWVRAGHRGVVVLPTGAGKTRVAVAAAAMTGAATLCLVPTRALLGQWVQAFEPHPVGQLGDGVRRVEHVTVATYASARIHAERLGRDFELLVVDEAHHFGGATSDVLEMFAAPCRLGLTACTRPCPTRRCQPRPARRGNNSPLSWGAAGEIGGVEA